MTWWKISEVARRRLLLLTALVVVGTLTLAPVGPRSFWPVDGTAADPQAGESGHAHHGPVAYAQTAPCWPDETPLGALPPAMPAWCMPLAQGKSTFVQGSNSWLDEFNHGQSMASFPAGYRVFQPSSTSLYRTEHFLHNDHWMVDISGSDQNGPPPWGMGGTLIRPDRSFRFQNGKLVVEADVAAGIDDYEGNVWPEIVVSAASAPTSVVDNLYAYGVFQGVWTVGCRLQASRDPICAMYDDTGRGAGAGGRTFEISNFQHEGAKVFGGGPYQSSLNAAWRRCAGTDPDLNCRDRFRWELTKNSLTIYVNGVKYMEHANLPPGKQLPDALVNGEVYVYFANWVYKSDAPTVRFHWDRLAINPSTGPSPAPGWSGSSGPTTPTGPTPTAAPTVTPTARPNPSPSPSASPTASPGTGVTRIDFESATGSRRPLNGQYPTGLIDWGAGNWWLAGHYGAWKSKSISFVRGETSATFSFVTPRRLVSLDVYNGGKVATTLTIGCSGQPTITVPLAAGLSRTVVTGWSGTCRTVQITNSNGWDTNFDNLVVDGRT